MAESLSLDGIELNDRISYRLDSIDMPPPKKRPQWVQNPDADGAGLVSEAHYESRVITATIRVEQQTTMNLAIDKIGALLDKLQLAERTEDGITLVWTPHGSTYDFTFYVLMGEVTELPMETSGDDAGYLFRAPKVRLELTCKPFGYGSEVTTSTTTNANALQEMTVEDVPGDVDAEAVIVVTDNATQSRKHVEVGRETNGYNTVAPQDLIIAKANMTATGYAGTTQTRDSRSVWRATLTNAPTAICATDETNEEERNHVGTYQAKLVGFASGTGPYRVRLTWRAGADTPYTSNAWAAPLDDNWSEVSLGLIDIPAVPSGQLQTWHGKIEAESDTPGDTFDVYQLLMIPAEQYGIGRGITVSSSSGPTIAYDGFDQTAGSTLSAIAAPAGGNWDEFGDVSPDWLISTPTGEARRVVTPADASSNTGQFVVLDGSSTITAIDIQADVAQSTMTGSTQLGEESFVGVIARFVDTNNFALAYQRHLYNSTTRTFQTYVSFRKRVAGTVTNWHYLIWANSQQSAVNKTVRLTIDTSGNVAVYWGAPGGDLGDALITISADSDLASAGALNDGKIGFYGMATDSAAPTLAIDNFTASTPVTTSALFPAIYSGQSAEFRHDSAERENSAGTGWGDIPAYRGAQFFLPPAGSTDRVSRVVCKARRTDVNDFRDAIEADSTTLDSTTLQVRYTPRYLVIPRS